VSVRSKDGFTIVEVIIAIVILAVGMLALASTSIVATTQVKIADLKTERSLAVQEVIEQLRAGPWTSVSNHAFSNGTTAGSYRVWWRVTAVNPNLRRVDVFTRGPGYISGQGWTSLDTDTFTVEIANAP
jgi:type IV pilus assembly protein PilV